MYRDLTYSGNRSLGVFRIVRTANRELGHFQCISVCITIYTRTVIIGDHIARSIRVLINCLTVRRSYRSRIDDREVHCDPIRFNTVSRY
ncbi:hypothetical protein D9M68_647510 [compost metagenome]